MGLNSQSCHEEWLWISTGSKWDLKELSNWHFWNSFIVCPLFVFRPSLRLSCKNISMLKHLVLELTWFTWHDFCRTIMSAVIKQIRRRVDKHSRNIYFFAVSFVHDIHASSVFMETMFPALRDLGKFIKILHNNDSTQCRIWDTCFNFHSCYVPGSLRDFLNNFLLSEKILKDFMVHKAKKRR